MRMPDVKQTYRFATEMYWWALLLTGCQEQSIAIVLDALERVDDLCEVSQPNLAQLRAAIVETAVSTISSNGTKMLPAVAATFPETREQVIEDSDWECALAALLRIEVFPRRALLLTVFLGYSLLRTSQLMNRDLEWIAEARATALCQFASSVTANQQQFHSKE